MIPAVVLAAGEGRRMGGPKALAPLRGAPLVHHTVRPLATAGCAPIVVVLGARAEEVKPHLPEGVQAVIAADWARGMRASLRAGLAVTPPDRDVLLTHVDRPIVRPETLQALIEAAGDRPVIPAHQGQPGHPVRLPASLRSALLDPDDDRPLREVLAALEPLVIEVDDPGVLINLNTPADLAAI